MEKSRVIKMGVVMATVTIIAVLALSLCACNTAGSEYVYALPEQLCFTASALQSAERTGGTLSVKIEAKVQPYNAINREVDYSTAWQKDASRKAEPVSDYLTVTQDGDGSTKATVTCKKAFGSDKIIITVTTRDGGYTADCMVSFVGKATGIEITSATAKKKTTSQRGTYYELGTGKTYTFDIDLTNDINSVGSSDLSVTTDAYGQLYFGTSTVDDSGFSRMSNMTKKNLSDFKDKFLTATVSGTTLTVKASSTYIDYFYDSMGNDEYHTVSYYYDRYVCEDEFGFTVGNTTADDYPGKAKENSQILPSCYFTVTVTDNISKLSQTIRLWVEISVTGVSLSSTLSI